MNGTSTCGASTLTVTAWEAEVPEPSTGGCLLDVQPGANCEVEGARVVAFDSPTDPFVRVSRSGMGAADGNTDSAPSQTCVAVGTTCP